MKELYASEITGPSMKELKEFIKWYNENLGNYPVIVGGWAVYCYTKGLGSKDIDVVFLGNETKHITLFDYFRSHGFAERSRGFFDKEFVKKVKSGGRDVEIIIDAVSSNRTIIFEGRKARLPWGWAVKHSIRYNLGKLSIYIPAIELLLVYKLGAILGRSTDLKTGLDMDYYRSKLWKDVYDVLSLARLKYTSKTVDKFLVDSGLDEYKTEILQAIKDNFDDEIKYLLKTTSVAEIEKILK